MRLRPSGIRGTVAAIAAGALVVLAPAAAFADNGGPTDPLTGVVDQVQQQLGSLGTPGTPGLPDPGLPTPSLPSAPSAPALPGAPTAPGAGSPSGSSHLPTSSDDDTAPHETTDPSGPDHAGTQGLHAGIAGQDVADAGQTRATARRHNATKADSTLLALGGQEILGAHASSTGTKESHAGNPLQPLCDNSGGQVCLQVLYADAYATNTGGHSHALARNGLADACIGGSHTDPTAACDGPVHAGVLTNSSRIDRNQRTGRTRAASRSDLADVCLTQPGGTGCSLSADALHSQGGADSASPSAKRGSYLLAVQGGGQGGRVDQPTAIQIPPGCPPPSALCAYLNQGESYLGRHLAGHAQDALTATLLPGQPIEVDALGGHTETLVHQQTGRQSAGEPTGSVSGVSAGGPGHPVTGAVGGESAALTPTAGLLPNTGGPWSGLLALALLAVAAGSFLLAFAARSRRLGAGRHLA